MGAVGSHHQGVAVRLGTRHVHGADIAARPHLVVHVHALPQRLAQQAGEVARGHIGALPRLVGHHDADGTAGVGLGQGLGGPAHCKHPDQEQA